MLMYNILSVICYINIVLLLYTDTFIYCKCLYIINSAIQSQIKSWPKDTGTIPIVDNNLLIHHKYPYI